MSFLLSTINQPTSAYGTSFDVKTYMKRTEWYATLNITALQKRDMAELKIMGFDIEEREFMGKGKLEISTYGPQLRMSKYNIKEKMLYKVFSGDQLNIVKGTVQVREFGNDVTQVEATANIVNSNTWTFNNVTWFQATDRVKIVKGSATSNTVPALVKITAVDTTTKELTFDANVTIDAGDYIVYQYTDSLGCTPNNKTVATNDSEWKLFEYHAQLFTRKVEIDNDVLEEVITSPQHRMIIEQKYKLDPSNEIFKEVSRAFRNGDGTGWISPKIKWYETIIQEREANDLKSIYDFGSLTTADDYYTLLVEVLRLVNLAPVETKFVMFTNDAFNRAYRNVLQKIRKDSDLRTIWVPFVTLHDGVMEWKVEEAPLLETYVSDNLTFEEPVNGTAYILPKDLCAGFTPRNQKVLIKENNEIQEIPSQFWVVKTTHRANLGSLECEVYDVHTKLGFAWGGVSYRDTFKKITNFNFGL